MIGEAVAGVLRIVAADDAELVGLPGQPRQVLNEADAGQGRRDGVELAADFRGRLRLGVEGVMMAGPAPHPELLTLAKSRQTADSQELTSGEAGAIAG